MKIVAVRCHVLRVSIRHSFFYSQGYYGSRGAVLVELVSDEGLSGWGDCAGDAATLPAYLEAHCAPRLLGSDPRAWATLWHELGGLGALAGLNAPAPVHYGALSGVQTALLDLAGQAAGLPIFALLGGRFRDRVRVYATGLYRLERWDTLDAWRDGLIQEALGYRDAGFSLCKLKIGFNPEDDVRLAHALRDAIGPEMDLAVDANCAWDAATAIRVGRGIEPLHIAWFEEPLPPDDLEGYHEVRRALAMPIAGGESLAGPLAFRRMVQSRAVDVVQPDIAVCGGFTAMQRVQALADTARIRLLPHCWGTALSVAASLHYLATVPDGLPPGTAPNTTSGGAPGIARAWEKEPLLEYDRSDNPLRDSLLAEPLRQEKGMLSVPLKPGLGVQIDLDALARFRVALREWSASGVVVGNASSSATFGGSNT